MLSESGKLQVSVEDTGIGIPPDKLKVILSMFEKVDSNGCHPQGCGLGLSITAMLLARLEGGPIQVQSAPQIGSIFSFLMPISSGSPFSDYFAYPEFTDEHSEIPFERHQSLGSALTMTSLSTPSAQVLIVDDVPFNRLVLRKILETAGYSYAEASTGLEAVSMVRAAWDRESPYSVVLMDVEMPEMDGITATRELLGLVASGVLGNAPVIIGCSAFSSHEDRAAALSSGMSHYLEKPISRTRLLELISPLCSS
jgi:CheY-like chemotaxis protein